MHASTQDVCYVARVQSSDLDRDGFGTLLAAIQKRTGMSDDAIAQAAGVSRSQVWRWVNSGSRPKYGPVARLAAFLMADRPEVAEDASKLLPSAGYESPPTPDNPRTRVTRALEADVSLQPYLDILEMERAAGIPPRSPGEQRIWDSQRYSEQAKRNLIAMIRQLDDDSVRQSQRGTGLGRPGLAVTGNGPEMTG